jgi:hypothetical protein
MSHDEGKMRRALVKWLAPYFTMFPIETEETQKGFPDLVGHSREKGILPFPLYIECKDCNELTKRQLLTNKIPLRPGQYPKLWKIFITDAPVFICVQTADCPFVFVPIYSVDPDTWHATDLSCIFQRPLELKDFITKEYLLHKQKYLQ